jgi:hypothetical protein
MIEVYGHSAILPAGASVASGRGESPVESQGAVKGMGWYTFKP